MFENSAYKEKYQANLDLMDSHVDKGMDPLVMAEKIAQIINTKVLKHTTKLADLWKNFLSYLNVFYQIKLTKDS